MTPADLERQLASQVKDALVRSARITRRSRIILDAGRYDRDPAKLLARCG